MISTIAKVALENLKAAGVDKQVTNNTIVIGPLATAESLAKISPENPFDLVFIDADTASNSFYFSEAKRLLRKVVSSMLSKNDKFVPLVMSQ